jgi:RNA 3'-terminal phosphate cyclase (ATP)
MAERIIPRPPYDFLEKVFVPLLNRLGSRVTTELIDPGFFPAGGGTIRITIDPALTFKRLELKSRGEPRGRMARAIVSNLPRNIADRAILSLFRMALVIILARLATLPTEAVLVAAIKPKTEFHP